MSTKEKIVFSFVSFACLLAIVGIVLAIYKTVHPTKDARPTKTNYLVSYSWQGVGNNSGYGYTEVSVPGDGSLIDASTTRKMIKDDLDEQMKSYTNVVLLCVSRVQ